MKKDKLPMTPLQIVVGFDVAEETYDKLPFMAQLILDLRIEGWKEMDIARALNIPQPTVNDIFRRTRYALADSKLKMILENRVYYRETHASVKDESSNEDQSNRNHTPRYSDKDLTD
jgi:predicted XRE-type DNA-binding protein